jgi:hypothetical protein
MILKVFGLYTFLNLYYTRNSQIFVLYQEMGITLMMSKYSVEFLDQFFPKLVLIVLVLHHLQTKIGRGLGPSSWLRWYEKNRE